MKKLSLVLLLVFLLSFSSFIYAGPEQFPEMPDSWFEAPKLASEVGITGFDQSPMFDKRVKNGELPSVEERLPDDPPVIEPYDKIGKYGGMANIWYGSEWEMNGNGWQAFVCRMNSRPLRPTPDGKNMVPSLIKGYEYSNNYKEITLYLRKGLKWSDGDPFDSEDFVYWWEHVATNKELNPIPPEKWDPPIVSVEAINKYTVKYYFAESSPLVYKLLAGEGYFTNVLKNPEHYMKQFHIGFRNKEGLLKEAKEAGYDTWHEYYNYKESFTHPDRGIRPTMNMYVVKERTASYVQLERNPYYPFVDTAGNQLPYIDEVRGNLAQDKEMTAMKATTGEATAAGFNIEMTDFPMYKANAKNGDFRVLSWTPSYPNWCAIQPNLSDKDSKLRKLFLDLRFRKALSFAINREEINEKIFFGEGTVQQTSVMSNSKYYVEGANKAFIEYNPKRARELLDKIGMKDVDGDGYRERPDGKIFNPDLVYIEGEGPRTPILELIKSYFEDIGIKIDLKLINDSLYYERRKANKTHMTMWHVNGLLDTKVEDTMGFFFAPIRNSWRPNSNWSGYITWLNTDGKKGVKPPKQMKELIRLGKVVTNTTDKEKRLKAGRKLVQLQAENIWSIGTVGLGIQPIIVDENLKNVPGNAYWSYSINFWGGLYDLQYYLDE